MRPGKVPPDVLTKYVFSHLGKLHPSVLVGPGLGEDASLIEIGDYVLAAATDPITGSISDIGWLGVHINANDIATFGIRPSWFLSSIILPSGTNEQELAQIMEQIDSAASSLDVAVVGGHTEVTDGIDRPILAGFMLGVTEKGRYVTSGGASVGDELLLTKCAGLEGTSILATEGEGYLEQTISPSLLKQAKQLRNDISVVEDGVRAFETGYVSAMHDPTEGGVANGIHEVCDASNLGCSIERESIPIHKSTREICHVLDVNPLHLISSGCMLIACREGTSQKIIELLSSHSISTTKIGRFTEKSQGRNIETNGSIEPLDRPETDALWDALKVVSQEKS